MSDLIPPVVYQLSLGATCGFIMGFAIKKTIKLLVIFAGLSLLFLSYLGFSGVISVNFDKLLEFIGNLINLGKQLSTWLIPIISTLPLTGSFIAGLVLGFRFG